MNESNLHVCSLSLTVLSKIHNRLSELTDENDVGQKYRLYWIDIAMRYNQQQKLQFVYNHLGSKGHDPRFRLIRMRPAFNEWVRQSKRAEWKDISETMIHKNIQMQIKERKKVLVAQRSELAARHFARSDIAMFSPLKALFHQENEVLKTLEDFVDPHLDELEENSVDFCSSSAMKTLSDVSFEEEDE